MVDIDDKEVAVVDVSKRKKLNYVCASCHQQKDIRCVMACPRGAIAATWARK
jgi:Fe-S-cluster-containing hydrogenase component 2